MIFAEQSNYWKVMKVLWETFGDHKLTFKDFFVLFKCYIFSDKQFVVKKGQQLTYTLEYSTPVFGNAEIKMAKPENAVRPYCSLIKTVI